MENDILLSSSHNYYVLEYFRSVRSIITFYYNFFTCRKEKRTKFFFDQIPNLDSFVSFFEASVDLSGRGSRTSQWKINIFLRNEPKFQVHKPYLLPVLHVNFYIFFSS